MASSQYAKYSGAGSGSGGSAGVSSLNGLTGGLTLVGANGITVTPSGSTITIGNTNLGTVTAVTASAPLASSGGTTPNISLTGIVTVPFGGTGVGTFTAYAPIVGGTTSTGVLQSVSNAGATVGQALTYQGASALPTWTTVSGGSGVTTLAPVGATPNANAGVISGTTLNLEPFSSTFPGVVTASGGGTTNFLRADGTWAAPSGSSGITQLTGDVTAGPGSGSQVATLATVNSNVGSFTNANITVNAKGLITAAANGTGGGGSVTSVSVVTANGFSGTVATPTTTPAITLSTSVTGVVKGSSGSLVAATAGTDYVIPSGSITGTAGNITATSNSTLTTLSALSLPLSQTTGVLPIAKGGTNNGSLSVAAGGVLTTDGSAVQNVGVGPSGYFLQSNGASAPTWVNTTPIGAAYSQGFFDGSTAWTTTSTSFADPASSGGTVFTVRSSNGITLTAASGNIAGVMWTPDSSSSTYLVTATFQLYNTTGGNAAIAQLTDGTNVYAASPPMLQATAGNPVCINSTTAIVTPGSTSPFTIKIQLKANPTGVAFINASSGAGDISIEWSVVKIANTGGGGGGGITEAQVWARVAYGM